MNPSYEEIIYINPRLGNRPREEYEKLLNSLIEKGYVWDDKQKFFYNEKIGMYIRTQGLDVFDSEQLERTFQSWSAPNVAKGMRLGQRYISNLLFLLFIDLFFGWIFIPFKFWLLSLIILLFITIVIQKQSSKYINRYKKEREIA